MVTTSETCFGTDLALTLLCRYGNTVSLYWELGEEEVPASESLVSWLCKRATESLSTGDSCLQNSQNAFPSLVTHLPFPLPDPEGWIPSPPSAPDLVLDSLLLWYFCF